MPEYVYQIEATFENIHVDGDRTDTSIVNMEHEDLFVCLSMLIEEHYPKKLIEIQASLVIDEDEEDDK